MSAPPQRLDHYELLELLGAGGMGSVYRAHDARLGRDVAIKLVHQDIAGNSAAKERFEREARALAALSHPNVLTVFDFGTHEGGNYLVMELLRGESLREVLHAGSLPIDKALQYARKIAQGLRAAHDLGIVHRDLKPENVFVTRDDQVKVLDFGLARLRALQLEETQADVELQDVTLAQPRQTAMGTIVGTASYMAPEQARGLVVDARSDLFALGAVLFDLITGRRAFDGPSAADIWAAILKQHPETQELPAAVARIVDRCLEKKPEQRFQSAADLIFALESARITSGTDSRASAAEAAAAEVKEREVSVAVLPLADMSPEKDQDYLCEGVAEEIINMLVQQSEIKVVARTSAFKFKGQSHDVRGIAEALGVSHVLEGSVRIAGNRLRVTAQLISADDGYHMWSDRFDRDMEDIFAIQDEIAERVVGELRARLGADPSRTEPAREQVPPERHTANIAAYHLYLKARHYRYTLLDFPTGLKYFEQAAEKDPSYPMPHVGLGESHALLGLFGYTGHQEAYARARREVDLALELGGRTAEVLNAQALLAFLYDWKWDEAEELFQQAVRLGPQYDLARGWYAWFLMSRRRFREAHENLEACKRIDPLSPYGDSMAAYAYVMEGRLTEAIEAAERALEIDPEYRLAHQWAGEACMRSGDFERAKAHLETAYRSGSAPLVLASLGSLAAVSGRTADAKSMLSQLKAPSSRALIHWHLREREEALALVDQAVSEHDPAVGRLRFVEDLTADTEAKRLLARGGLA